METTAPGRRERPSRTAALTAAPWFRTGAAVLFVFLWGSAFVPSKVGVLESSPLWFLVVRFAVSGALALAIARAAGAGWPQGWRAWALVALLGVLANAIYLGANYEALRHLAAGVGAIVSSTNPLLLALVAPWLLAEPLTGKKALGMVLGFGGVVAIMFERAGSGTAEPRDVALALLGVVASVASTIVYKKFLVALDVRMTTALQLLAASLAVLPFAALTEGAPHAHWGLPIVLAFLFLVLAMSIGGSLLWFWLLERGEASRVSAYYFLSPVFGLGIASLFGEPLSWHDLGGLAA
ncbi:MAG TPA: DMT family transporter, partial [Candidatus Eremiobacteraceae bacterium]|nr:DMT family transporter [Candidatus Eremiobacteraceae bacterium]